MNICSHKHDEVVYEGKYCPMCAIIEEKDKFIEELEDRIGGLVDELAGADL